MGEDYVAPPKTIKVAQPFQVEEVNIYSDHSMQFEEFADSLAEDVDHDAEHDSFCDSDSMDCGPLEEYKEEDYDLMEGDLDDSDNELEVDIELLLSVQKEIETNENLKKQHMQSEEWAKIICDDGKTNDKCHKMKHNGQRGDSRRSNQRHRKAHADLVKVGNNNNNSLDSCWRGCQSNCSKNIMDYCVDIKKDVEESVESVVNQESKYRTRDPGKGYQMAIDVLKRNGAKIVKNKREEVKRNKTTSSYQHVQYIAVARYLQLLLEGNGKMESSDKMARVLFAKKISKGKHNSTKGSYISRSIRNWADNFLDEGCIMESRQGKHIRILNVLTSKEVQTRLIAHLQNTPMIKR